MIEYWVFNSFTDTPFLGNPAGIVIDKDRVLSSQQMQIIATQLNLVETTFIFIDQQTDRVPKISMRYFTPLKELPITGHPTLAGWACLKRAGYITPIEGHTYDIHTNGGIIKIYDEDGLTFLSQQNPVIVPLPQAEADHVPKVFSLCPEEILSEFPISCANAGLGHIIFGVTSLTAMQKLSFDIETLQRFCERNGAQECQIFTFDTYDKDADIHTRNLCPRPGLEDPACGNGNAALGGYLLTYQIKNEIQYKAEQGHIVGKPSLIQIKSQCISHDAIASSIGGHAAFVSEGKISIPRI